MKLWMSQSLSRLLFCVACFLMLLPQAGLASEGPETIRYHTPEWKGLTNKDGTGLYHEIIRTVFAARGITVEATYFPFRRALMNVANGEADVSGATIDDTLPHILAKHPIWVSWNNALFHRRHLADWRGIETIEDNPTDSVSPPGIGKIIGIRIHEVSTRDQALNMVIDGRMKYYIDDFETLNKLKAGEKNVVGFEGWKPPTNVKDFDWGRYVIRDVIPAPAYMIFQDTEQGRRLRDIFDEEFERLHRSGELAKIYEKWGLGAKMPRKLAK